MQLEVVRDCDAGRMVLEFTTGDILNSDADAIVIPVNCVGIMGAGLALQFKEKYSRIFEEYKEACNKEKLKLGEVYPIYGSKIFIMFPTKYHWKDKSYLFCIRDGLVHLGVIVVTHDIKVLAIPKIGCGLGGLNWEKQVKPLIVDFSTWSQTGRCRILVYE